LPNLLENPIITARARNQALIAAVLAVLVGLGASLGASPTAASATITAGTATSAAACPVAGATLTWGFKESFRSYISSTIANGEWTVADGATYETPDFGWADGEGSYDGETGEGLVAFTGSITFTGHGDILNTTVANPQFQFVDASTAMLILDVTGTTQEGEAVDELDVEFVELDLTDAVQIVDGSLTVTDATALLTPAGAAAFGTYPDGEPFDPVSLTAEFDASCVDEVTVAPGGEDANAVTESASLVSSLWWVWVLIIGVGIAVALVLRRRGPQAPGA